MNEFEWIDKIEEAYILPKGSFLIPMGTEPCEELYGRFCKLYGYSRVNQNTWIFNNPNIKNRIDRGKSYFIIVQPNNEYHLTEWECMEYDYGSKQGESVFDEYVNNGHEVIEKGDFLRGIYE